MDGFGFVVPRERRARAADAEMVGMRPDNDLRRGGCRARVEPPDDVAARALDLLDVERGLERCAFDGNPHHHPALVELIVKRF